jgi:hypothetical protein
MKILQYSLWENRNSKIVTIVFFSSSDFDDLFDDEDLS